MLEDNSMATFWITPGDSALHVADHVARAAFETLFVVEQNAPVVRWDKELGGAGNHAGLGGAASADFGVDHDVSCMRDSEINGRHAIVETDLRTADHSTQPSGDRRKRESLLLSGPFDMVTATGSTSRSACPTGLN